jgi:TPR repeat protein
MTQAFLSLALAGWGLTGVIAGRWLTVKRTMIIATVIYAVAIGWFAIALDHVRANSFAAAGNSHAVTITSEQYPKALELSSRDCDAGDARACGNLGFMYEHGYGVTMDYPLALSLYSKACDMRLAIGCRRLGFMYMFGRSVSPDVSKEKLLFSKGCDGGDEDACTALKSLTESTSDVH